MVHVSCRLSVLVYIQTLGQADVLGRHAHWSALAHVVLVLVESLSAGAGPGTGSATCDCSLMRPIGSTWTAPQAFVMSLDPCHARAWEERAQS